MLRLSATLLFISLALLGVPQLLHPGGDPTYEATFADYAASGNWVGIHLGQFVGMAVATARLLVLFFALNISQGTLRWVGLFSAIAAGMALALYGVFFSGLVGWCWVIPWSAC